jgi:DinB family protein
MTSTAGRRLRGRAAGKRGGKKKARATAKRRARARVRASRPKQKPKRTPKARSRARRTAKTSGTKRAGAAPARVTKRATGAAASPGTKRASGAAGKARPRLEAVPARKRRAARPAPPPAFPQTAGAPARSQLMFRMVKARASVLAAVQGMGAATAERPLGEGKWSTRETILHLVTRDRARLREMEAALRGVRPSWEGWDPQRQALVNEEDLAPLRPISWDDAIKLLLTTRQELMEAIESIPEEPAEVWGGEHALGWMFQRLPAHDLHHAESIKRWRTEQGA